MADLASNAYYARNKHDPAFRAHRAELSRQSRRRNPRLGRKQTQERRAWLRTEKAVPCADCRGSFPVECMDFDHVRGAKLFNLAKCYSFGWEAIYAEREKCDVVCSNCHRIRTRRRELGPNWP